MKTEDIEKILEPFAKAIGVAVSELWKMFSREYVVKGAVEIAIGLFLVLLYMTLNLPFAQWVYVRLALLPFVIYFVASGIRFAFNPGYYALTDLVNRVDLLKNGTSRSSRY